MGLALRLNGVHRWAAAKSFIRFLPTHHIPVGVGHSFVSLFLWEVATLKEMVLVSLFLSLRFLCSFFKFRSSIIFTRSLGLILRHFRNDFNNLSSKVSGSCFLYTVMGRLVRRRFITRRTGLLYGEVYSHHLHGSCNIIVLIDVPYNGLLVSSK